MSIQSVVVLIAMQEEADPAIAGFGLSRREDLDPHLPMRRFGGLVGDLQVDLVTCGQDEAHQVANVATQPATLAAYLSIRHLRPDVVINAGTAGAFSARGASVGDVYVSHRHVVFHDRIIPLPGYCDYGIGRYPVVDVSRMAVEFGIKQGLVSTGNSLVYDAPVRKFMLELGADLEDMEAAAIAWVCHQLETPFIALKAVTNLLDTEGAAEEEFEANLVSASQELHRALDSVLAYLLGKQIADLGLRVE